MISYYKSKMPKKGWTKLMDAQEDEGWGSAWHKKDGRFVANVTVVEEDDGCHILLGRHEGKK